MPLGDKIEETIKSEELQNVTTEVMEVVLDSVLEDGVLKELPVIGGIFGIRKGYLSIQDALFTRKLFSFLYQLKGIPDNKRKEEIEKINQSNEYRMKVGEKILYIIDKSKDHEKARLQGVLFGAFLNKDINYTDFLRCTTIVQKSFIDDLVSVIENNIDRISLEESNELLNSGLFYLEPTIKIDFKNREEVEYMHMENKFTSPMQVSFETETDEFYVNIPTLYTHISHEGHLIRKILRGKI